MSQVRDQGLDVLRAIAILMVLFLHVNYTSNSIPDSIRYVFSYGWIGVDLFFVLSGFLIGQQALFYRPKENAFGNLKIFWIKRWYRTLPLYFTVLCTYLFLKPMIFGVPFGDSPAPFFVFLQNYFPLTDFVQSWSICIEEQFYLLLPIATYFVAPNLTKKPWFWAMMVIISFLTRFLVVQNLAPNVSGKEIDQFVRFPLYTHFDGMACGVFLASTFHVWKTWPKQFKNLSLTGGASLFFLTCFALGPKLSIDNSAPYFILLSISFALCLVGMKGLTLPVSLWPPVKWVSILSYGAYLWNNVFIRLVEKFFRSMHWTLGMVIFLFASFFVAWLTYKFVEKPFMNLRKKVLDQALS